MYSGVVVSSIIAKLTYTVIPCWKTFKISMAVEIGLWHSHPFTKSHFAFFIVVESAISRVLLQQSKKRMVRRRMVGRIVFPSERTVTAVVSEVRCMCIVVLNDHTSRRSTGVFRPYVGAVGWHTR
jgi:hypothetical protein